jgi:hypothetical protein
MGRGWKRAFTVPRQPFTRQNLAKMIALRIMRINGHWEEYWRDLGQKAA